MHVPRRATALVAALVSALLLVVTFALPASAEPSVLDGEIATPVGGTDTATLAATGLDLAVPLIIGLSGLVLGMLLIGWGMLRRGNSRH